MLYGNPSGAIRTGCGALNTSGGNTLADPLFLNRGAADLHLQAASPAIDAAIGDWALPYDKDGVARPQGAGTDIGAYER